MSFTYQCLLTFFALALLACLALYLDAVQKLHYALTPEDELGEAMGRAWQDMEQERDAQAEAMLRAIYSVR